MTGQLPLDGSRQRNVRAAAQVRVVDGVAEVEAELNALGGQRTEHVLADGASQHGQGVCRTPQARGSATYTRPGSS